RPAIDDVAFPIGGVDRVGPGVAVELVCARPAGDHVVARSAVDHVVSGAAQQRVVPAHPEDRVVPAAAGEVLAVNRADDVAAAPATFEPVIHTRIEKPMSATCGT